MSKKCSITPKSKTLAKLMTKYGEFEGFRMYYTKRSLEAKSDDVIEAEVFMEDSEVPVSTLNVNPGSKRGLNALTESIEETGKLASWSVKNGMRNRTYNVMPESRADQTANTLNNSLREAGLYETYKAVKMYDALSNSYFVKVDVNDNTDYLVSNANVPFLEELQRRSQELSRENMELSKERRAGGIDAAREREILKRQGDLNSILADINDTMSQMRSSFTIDDLNLELDADFMVMDNFFSKDEFTYEEVRQAIDKLEVWAAMSDVPVKGKHPFLDEIEIANEGMSSAIISKARTFYETYADAVAKRRDAAIIQFTRDNTVSDELSNEQILEILQDMNVLRAETLNPGQANQPLLQAVFSAVTKVNLQFQEQADRDLDELLRLAKAVSKDLLTKMRQVDSAGRQTGFLVNPYSNAYYEAREDVLSAVRQAKNTFYNLPENVTAGVYQAAKTALQNAQANMAAFYKDFHSNINPTELVADEDTSDGIVPDKYIDDRVVADDSETTKRNELIELVGERQADIIIKSAKNKVKKYQSARDAYYLELLGTRSPEQGLTADDTILFEFWLKQNSPYQILEPSYETMTIIEEGSPKKSFPRFNFVESIPNPSNKEFFDQNYKEVVADPVAAKLYDLFRTFFAEGRDMLGDIDGFLNGMSIPLLEESLFKQMYDENGLLAAGTYLRDSVVKNLRESQDNSLSSARINPATNRATKRVNISAVSEIKIKNKVKARFEELQSKWKQENPGKYIPSDTLKELQKQAIDEVYNESSSNIIGAMAYYRVNTLMAGHRRSLEPHMDIIKSYIDDLEVEDSEIVLFGSQSEKKLQKKLRKTRVEKGEAANIKKNLDHFLDDKLYGLSTKKQKSSGTKILTSAEKKELQGIKERLNETLEKIEEYQDIMSTGINLTAEQSADLDNLEKKREFYEKQFENIGGVASPTKVADGVIRVVQALGIGFSVPSAVANTGFGYLANIMQAGKGRDLSTGGLQRGYRMVTGTVALSATKYSPYHGHAAATLNDLVKRFSIGTTPVEQKPTTNYRTFGKKNIFGRVKKGKSLEEAAYVMMEKTEYVNQASLLAGIMLDTTVTLKDETKTNLFEVYNNPDLSPADIDMYKIYGGDKFREFDELQFFVYAKNVVHTVHGDYENKMRFKRTLIGRSLAQYRTWMARTYTDRFDTERYDAIGGYTTKGKYRSAIPVFEIPLVNMIVPPIVIARTKDQKKKNKTVGFKEGLGLTARNSLGTVKTFAKAFSKNPAKTLKLFKEELAKEYEKVDAENIASVYGEWVAYTTLSLLGKLMILAASSMFDDDDEEFSVGKGSIIFALNMLNRFQNDLAFYTNPLEASRLIDNPVPAYFLQEKGTRLFDSLGRIFDDRPIEIQSGIYEGWWWPARDAVKLVPGIAGIDKVYRNMSADLATGRKVGSDFTVFSDGDLIDKALGIDKKEED